MEAAEVPSRECFETRAAPKNSALRCFETRDNNVTKLLLLRDPG